MSNGSSKVEFTIEERLEILEARCDRLDEYNFPEPEPEPPRPEPKICAKDGCRKHSPQEGSRYCGMHRRIAYMKRNLKEQKKIGQLIVDDELGIFK